MTGWIFMVDLSFLGAASDIWNEWRYEPWRSDTASGLYRRVTMKKSGLLGEVARYYADDYIIWRYAASDPERIFRAAKQEEDLLLQRFVFLTEKGAYSTKKRSLFFGLRGFAELHFYTPGSEPPKAIVDAAYLVNAACAKIKKR
ncbi:MAG: hypothetical protein RR501_05755 [Cloacibacillus sp.]